MPPGVHMRIGLFAISLSPSFFFLVFFFAHAAHDILSTGLVSFWVDWVVVNDRNRKFDDRICVYSRTGSPPSPHSLQLYPVARMHRCR